jgi:hypothetical protein
MSGDAIAGMIQRRAAAAGFRCEIATFRYRVLHVAARISHSARRTRLRIDQTWRWAQQITQAWHHIRAAFT